MGNEVTKRDKQEKRERERGGGGRKGKKFGEQFPEMDALVGLKFPFKFVKSVRFLRS